MAADKTDVAGSAVLGASSIGAGHLVRVDRRQRDVARARVPQHLATAATHAEGSSQYKAAMGRAGAARRVARGAGRNMKIDLALAGVAGAGAVGLAARRRPEPVAKDMVGSNAQSNYAAKVKRRKDRVAARPRKPYFNPTPEQQHATAARRVVQAGEKASRATTRIKGAAVPWRSHIHGGQVANAAISAGVVGGAAYLVHRDRKRAAVVKADHRRRDIAAGAVGGAAAADVAAVVGGQGGKAALKIRRAKRGESPADAAVWSAHKKSHGVPGRAGGSIPNAQKLKVYSSYPKALPDWRAQRVLAFKNRPAVAAASAVAGAGAGAALVHHLTRRPAVSKAQGDTKRRAELGGAAAVGAGAGQGAYQVAGYRTKHYVDMQTRKEHGVADQKEAVARDKVLKPLKVEHGMMKPKTDPTRSNVNYHRAYPKDLSYSRQIRAMGHTHEGGKGVAIGAGVTAVGALGAGYVAHRKLRKSLTRQEKVHGVEVASTGTATAVGTVFGAAKLRDAYKKENSEAFDRHLGHAGNKALDLKIPERHVTRAMRAVRYKSPGFKPVALAVGAGTLGAVANHYGNHLAYQKAHPRKDKAPSPVAKSAFGVEH